MSGKNGSKAPTLANIRRNVLSIAFKALGPIDDKTRWKLQSMDVETLTTCVGLMLRAKAVAIDELKESVNTKSKGKQPRCEQPTHDRRSTRCRGKGHS